MKLWIYQLPIKDSVDTPVREKIYGPVENLQHPVKEKIYGPVENLQHPVREKIHGPAENLQRTAAAHFRATGVPV